MKIDIKGVIIDNSDSFIYDIFDIDYTSPKAVIKALEENSKAKILDIDINSPGGSVFAGSEIYTALKLFNGKINVNIVGIAASAASVIAMAGDTVNISPTAQIMIHNVSSVAMGDYRDLQKEAGVIENYNKSIANSYILKTGLEESKILDMMNEETWLNAQQAKELGFVDSILFDMDNKLDLVAGMKSCILPKNVIDKVRNLALENKELKAEKAKFRNSQRLKLLKLLEVKEK